jgi:flavorubredoxin
LNDQVKTYTPWVWKGFISHFSMGHSDCIVSLKDSGGKIPIGDTGREVIAVPAHYCHSPGNFSIYDPIADILFSGDIGAALLPDANVPLFVENFDDHIQYMEAFHVRWMPSSEALKNWARRVRELNPKMICPQHGSIFKGKDVTQFLTWIENLTVGKY